MLHDQEPVLEGAQTSCKCILIVADDPDLGEDLVDVLSHKLHCHVFLATNSFAALTFVRHIKPRLFILEHRLPNMNGIALYHRLHANRELEAIPAILIGTGLEDGEDDMDIRKLMAFRTPWHLEDFLSLIEEVLA
jgi:DNA-binding response OmpR family regulator